MDKLGAYRTFVRVVEAGSFSAAARELGVGQPAVSKQVATLELALGTALLTRSTRRLHVTDAGERLYEAALAILDQVERAEATVRQLDREPAGRLRVNLPVVFGQTCVVPLLGEFLSRHPRIELDVRFTDRLVDLRKEGVDLLIRVGPTDDTSLVARKLGVTRRAVVASPAYLEAHGSPTEPDDLREHACLMYAGSRGHRAGWMFMSEAGVRTVRVEPRLVADNGQALGELARQGAGITMLATWLVGPDIEAGRLRVLLPAYEPPPLPVVALYPSRRFLPHRARRFVQLLQERFTEHPYLRGQA